MSKPKMPKIRVKLSPRTGEYLAIVNDGMRDVILGSGYTRGAAKRRALSYLHAVIPDA